MSTSKHTNTPTPSVNTFNWMSSLKTQPGKTVMSRSDDNSYTTLKGTMLLKTLFCNKKVYIHMRASE